MPETGRSGPTLCCMAGNTSGTPRARAIGAELRKAREAADLGLRELTRRLGWTAGQASTLSRFESGERQAKPEDVATILTALDVPPATRERIIALAAEPDNGHSWSPITIPEQTSHLAAYLEFEHTATRITEGVWGIVPGLCQTEAYMRAIISKESQPADVEPRVAMRLGRRKVLYRADPVQLIALIGEPALDSNIGGREVMIGQLQHLAKMAELPNVDVRIIPTDSDYVPLMVQNFAIFEFSAASPIVHTETRLSGMFLHEEADVLEQTDAAERTLAAALSPQLSAEKVAEKLADRMENK
jgi:transcriptional regulator with XRE-family HTH domain